MATSTSSGSKDPDGPSGVSKVSFGVTLCVLCTEL